MNLAFADRDFYYGDPYFAARSTPIKGLLSKEYARERAKLIDWEKNDPNVKPGDPYPFQGETNPFREAPRRTGRPAPPKPTGAEASRTFEEGFTAGTTSIEAADEEGWVVSVTPSGGWIPATIAGTTGVGMSQRMQSFVLDEAESPFNVLEPGKRPRVDADAEPRAQGRQAVPGLRRAGRRHAGPEPAPVLPERRRVRHERAAGVRGGQLQQLPDAQLVRRARGRSRAG